MVHIYKVLIKCGRLSFSKDLLLLGKSQCMLSLKPHRHLSSRSFWKLLKVIVDVIWAVLLFVFTYSCTLR